MSQSPTRSAREAALLEKDIESIGAHCDVPHCHRLDFLPFRCESCRKTHCLDHRTEAAHSCTAAGKWLETRRKTEEAPSAIDSSSRGRTLQEAKKCARENCKTTINTNRDPGVLCATCRQSYCLSHRLPESGHECKAPPQPAKVAAQKKTKDALAKFRKWAVGTQKEMKEKVETARRPASVTEVMKMKREAKGDDKVAFEKRVYLFVEAEAKSTTSKLPKGVYFYSKDWTVGRMMDAAAKSLMVQNVNNQSTDEEKRLRVFHVEGGRVLQFGEKVGDVAQNGNTFVLLRGIGATQYVPDLIEM